MKKILFFILFLVSPMILWAQEREEPDPEDDERMVSVRIAFISQHINLTPEQAEKFWPVYNQFAAERKALRKEMRRLHKSLENIDETSAEKNLNRMLEIRTKEVNIEKQYIEKFKKVISYAQIAKLYQAEFLFKKKLLDGLREGGGGKHQGGGRF